MEASHSEHAIIGYLAALQAGHAGVLLPPTDPALGAVIDEAFAPEISFLHIDGRWWLIEPPRSRGQHGIPPHPDLALLLMTSGSTGRARAVKLSTRNLDANAASIAQYLGLTPLHYCYGLSVLHSHLSVGAKHLFPENIDSGSAIPR
ncbi:AMP-binding protein [Rhizobium sp. PL01]|uniref:AMP-binding protein n=1 Tax=Rhizobium sp. PL01 TaxID=3085631 RepID=UPI002982421C|nr:AMP-binding protein [Rhizobium sp. PL01]MDW5316189.1 AMP-binding protein [Rhizobium sp. PL01]